MLKSSGLLGLVVAFSILPAPVTQASDGIDTELSGDLSLPAVVPQVMTTHVDHHPDPIVIGGKVFGEKEGLIKVEISGVVSEGESLSALRSPVGLMPQGWAPYYNTKISWGASWVRNQEIGYLLYRGSTQAGGNVYRGQRIIQTTLKYKRSGNILGSATSHAKYQENHWVAGSVDYTRTWDSLNSNAPQTEFYYSYYAVAPNVTG